VVERPDGAKAYVLPHPEPLRNAAGDMIGAVNMLVDITARKHAEESLRALDTALQKKVEELADADRRKNEFLAMLAHELRNPLTPIRSGLDVLELETGGNETIRLMQEQVDHLVRLVDDLLDLSRIVRGRVELRREPVELAKVIGRAVQTVRPLLQERQHRLSLSLPHKPVWLNADAVRMAQIFSNLLHNAAKYTDRGGQITLTAEQSTGGVMVRVRDNGIGIDRDLLPCIFDLFTQSDRSIDRSQGGLGIGLTLVRSLVEMHDGTIAAHSDGPGTGSEFTVALPVLSEYNPPRMTSGTPASIPSRRVLVVDDNVGAAKMLALLLDRCGTHEIVLAHDGPTALDAAAVHHPDIILLDIGLPRMSGYEVARRLRSQPEFEHTRLVAVTGYGQPEDRRRALDAGFDEHLVKPPAITSLMRLFEAVR
jgi:signal transduction histidine kinase/CheY-like chemotaxis protein